MSRDDISMKNKIPDEIARFWLVLGVLLGSGTEPWRSFKINEFQGKSMEIMKNHRFSSNFNILMNLMTPSGLGDSVPATKT